VQFDSTAARYKCMNCLEVVLCELCESKCVHNPIHLLVKLRIPTDQLSLEQQLIFTSHIEDCKERAKAKAQKKEIRKAMRKEKIEEIKKKQERIKARKERIRRRALARKKMAETKREKARAKKEKKQSAVPEVVPLVGLESAVVNSLPSVEQPVEAAGVLTSIVDPIPPEEVIASESVTETVIEDVKQQEPPKEDAPNQSEGTLSIDAPQLVAEQEQSWSVLDIMNSFYRMTNTSGTARTAEAEPQINVNDYRIQGISFRQKLDELESMGFTDRNRNIVVLVKHLANLERAVEELVSS